MIVATLSPASHGDNFFAKKTKRIYDREFANVRRVWNPERVTAGVMVVEVFSARATITAHV
jgi:hypothetical protein